MYRLVFIFLIFVLALSVNAAPTMKSDQLGFRDWLGGSRSPSFNLFDPSKLTVQHNLSFGFSSGGSGSLAQSLYMTKLGYRLSDPVTLTFLLGVQNNQYSGKMNLPSNYNNFMGGFAVDYRPHKDVFIHLEMLHSPGYMYLSNQNFYPYKSPLLDE